MATSARHELHGAGAKNTSLAYRPERQFDEPSTGSDSASFRRLPSVSHDAAVSDEGETTVFGRAFWRSIMRSTEVNSVGACRDC